MRGVLGRSTAALLADPSLSIGFLYVEKQGGNRYVRKGGVVLKSEGRGENHISRILTAGCGGSNSLKFSFT